MTKGFQTKKAIKSKQLKDGRQKPIDPAKAILERNDNFDSTSSTTTTESTEDYLISLDEEEEIAVNIFDTLYDNSYESVDAEEIEQEPDYLQQESLVKQESFFENFTQLPDIKDISEDISIATVIIEKEITLEDTRKDVGHFVDPLTGLELQTNALDISTNDLNAISRETIAEEQTLSSSQHTEESDIFLPEDSFFEAPQHITYDIGEEQTKDLFETFLELDITKLEEPVEEFDWEAIIKEQEAKRLRQQTLDFINDLIHKVVEIAEFVSPETILRQNLDKHKLVREISNVLQQQRVEIKVSELLNRKLVEYFKRKKLYRPIIQENFKTLPQEKENYMKAINRLDKLLGREKNMKESSSLAVKNLSDELKTSEQKVQMEVLKFESMVKKNLFRDSNTQHNDILEIMLRKMAKYRKEVSDLRYQMITKQHTHAILLEKLAVLEDLGNGLTMKDYDHIQTENQTLDKKIEERNIELKKLHLRSHHSLHLLAHFKEKRRMIIDVITTQRSALNELFDERSSLRKYIHQLKLKRDRIRHEIKDLSIQGGLLDKPALMYDYDQTVKRLNELHEIVNGLKMTLESIQQRINKLEKRSTMRNNHNFSMII